MTVAAALGLSLLSVAVNVVLAAMGQWDRTRTEFRPEAAVEVSLTRGDQRIVYLGATESLPFNFDFYPSDFRCSANGPGGQVDLEPERHHRHLDVWQSYASVESLTARESGVYQLSCGGRRDATLILARPARFRIGWVSPMLATYLLAFVALVALLVLLMDLVVERLRIWRTADSEASSASAASRGGPGR